MKVKKPLIILAIVGSLAGAGVLSAPALKHKLNGSVFNVPTEVSQSPNQSESLIYSGKRIRFSYQPKYQLKLVDDAAFIERYSLATASGGQSMTLSIKAAANANLNGEPEFVVRKSQPSVYIASTRDVKVGSTAVFTKASGDFEKSLFWQHKGVLLHIVSQGPSNQAGPSGAEFTKLLDSLMWL
ncbi:MAG: hypothetical protein JWS12_138 [Candidatus Saccharibacteria bacterium]|nr:hypothetical protein [Candidatus Saccharibacteria bacterium]